jgi:cysteine desulfurase
MYFRIGGQKMKVYDLDHASTTKLDPIVYEKMKPYLETYYGNPSSIHQIGIENKKAINGAKKGIAQMLNCDYNELIFTGSGTEAINLAIKGVAFKYPQKKEIITTPIEHKATLNAYHFLESIGYHIIYLKVDHEGYIDLDDLSRKISHQTLLVSIIWANNEIGVIQDIDKISKIVKKRQVFLHVDAVQMLGHYLIDLQITKVDLMSFSAHKIYGPKGIGLLYKRQSIEIEPLIHGGNQEFSLRAGTENIYGIIGFYEAIKRVREIDLDKQNELVRITRVLYKKLATKFKLKLNGPELDHERLPGLLSLSFDDIKGHVLQYQLNQRGICVSTGSACNETLMTVSHVIQAINPHGEGTIRLSLGYDLTDEDIDYIISQFEDILLD